MRAATIAATLLTPPACGGRAPDLGEDAPGTEAWRGELACKADADCLRGEGCVEGICQMKRCAGDALVAAQPLGKSGYLLLNRELVAITADRSFQTYASKDGVFEAAGEPFEYLAAGTMLDVAGGNLLGNRPDALAMVFSGSTEVALVQGGKNLVSGSLGFVPIGIATGDADGDGTDEVVAASVQGTIAVCKVGPDRTVCTSHQGPSGIVDIAMGDVDGDGFAEPILLAGNQLYVYNLDAEKTKQPKLMTFSAGMASAGTERTMFRIAAGDLDGNGTAEIVGLEHGWAFWSSDKLDVFTWTDGTVTFQHSADVPTGSLDVHVDPLNGNGVNGADIAVLAPGGTVEMLRWGAQEGISVLAQTALPGGFGATRLAGADVDGNSPRAVLKGKPRIVSGPILPLTVLTFPPYSTQYSQGPSSVALGKGENASETHGETVAANFGVSVGTGFPIIPALLKASVSANINWSWATTKAFNKSVSVGESFALAASPEADGWDSGAVVIACACYQQFEYDVADPAHLMGPDADGAPLSVNIPVGGQTSVWSIRRYNALAEALKTLPKIKLPYRLGEIDSYPKEPQALDGSPIPPEDLVFPNAKTIRVSDSAHTDFSLSASETTINASASTIAVGGAVGLNAANVDVTFSGGGAWTTTYDIAVGPSTSFSGGVEPIRNNRDTPEDEFALNAYSFKPVVYRQHYTDANQKDSAFYVLVYSVGR